MKLNKWFAWAGVLTLSVAVLAACSSGQKTATKTYSYVYGTDPDSLDYLVANRAVSSDVTSNVVDGLLENDKYGNLVPSLAEDWSVSKDGLTYTYTLRKGSKWSTVDGEEYAEVKAQDFVAGLKHAADKKSEALYLVQDSIKGLDAYIKGESKDFASVGIKAVDDYTLQYTLNKPESFWNSKTTMGILFPVNEEFLKSQGDKFGTTGQPDTLLYNGPFILKSMTAKSSIEYAKNQNYWDKDHVALDAIKLSYFDGQDQESLIRNFVDGVYTVGGLYPSTSTYPKYAEKYKDEIIYSPQDATSYYYTFNLNRQSYKHTAKTTDAQKESTKKAVLNKDFRQAINFAFDRLSYAAQSNGEDGANKILRNSLVPPTFVQIGDKDFGAVADQLTAKLGEEWQGLNTQDAQDAFYNPEKAKAEFTKAKDSLKAEGVEFPIHLDLLVSQTNVRGVKEAQSLKQSIESVLGAENVVIDLLQLSDDEVNNATYFAQTAAQKDYDFSPSGWTPDYQDPSTYLDTLDPDKGASISNLGLDPAANKEVAEKVGLNDYQKLLAEANAETQDVSKRYEKYAAAQAWLTDSGLTIPYVSIGGVPAVRKTVPYSGAYSLVGTKGSGTYKLVQIQDEVVKVKDYEAAREKWKVEKAKSNAQAQEDLAKHVK